MYAVAGGTGPAKKAGEALNKILRGEEGKLDAFTDWVSSKRPFGKFDMGEISSKMEASASKRAFTTSYIRAYRDVWQPGKGFDALSTYLPTHIRDELGPDLVRLWESRVANVKMPDELNVVFSDGKNLNLTADNILKGTADELGYDINRSMPPEYIEIIRDGLEEAAEKGTVREFFDGLRKKLAADIDALGDKYLDNNRVIPNSAINLFN